MNRGFATYFKQAITSSARTIYKNKHGLGVLAYFFMELIARFTLIFSAVFDIANVRQAKLARKGEAELGSVLRVRRGAYSVRTMIYAIILEAMIFLGGILIIAIGGASLGALGYLVSTFIREVAPGILIGAFAAPAGIVLMVYFVIMPILFAPTPYVIESNPGIAAGDVITVCFRTMKSRGKWTCALCALIPTMMANFAISSCGVMISMIRLYLFRSRYFQAVLVAGIIVTIAVFLLVYPMFTLTRKAALTGLFEDITLDEINAAKHTSGVNIKRCSGDFFPPETIEENLAALFDETKDDSVPLAKSNARRKHEREIKAESRSFRDDFTVNKAVRTHAPEAELEKETVIRGEPVKRTDGDAGKAKAQEAPAKEPPKQTDGAPKKAPPEERKEEKEPFFEAEKEQAPSAPGESEQNEEPSEPISSEPEQSEAEQSEAFPPNDSAENEGEQAEAQSESEQTEEAAQDSGASFAEEMMRQASGEDAFAEEMFQHASEDNGSSFMDEMFKQGSADSGSSFMDEMFQQATEGEGEIPKD